MNEKGMVHVGDFTAHADRKTSGECPACEEPSVLYYLGCTSIDGAPAVGWVCENCESEVLEVQVDNNDWQFKNLQEAHDE